MLPKGPEVTSSMWFLLGRFSLPLPLWGSMESELWNPDPFQVKCKQFHLKIAELTLSQLLAASWRRAWKLYFNQKDVYSLGRLWKERPGKDFLLILFISLLHPFSCPVLRNTFKIYWQTGFFFFFFFFSETCWNKNYSLFKGPIIRKHPKGTASGQLTLLLPWQKWGSGNLN